MPLVTSRITVGDNLSLFGPLGYNTDFFRLSLLCTMQLLPGIQAIYFCNKISATPTKRPLPTFYDPFSELRMLPCHLDSLLWLFRSEVHFER